MPDRNWIELQGALEAAVREAGALALRLRPNLKISTKPDGSPVTNADVAVEALLRESLKSLRPRALFLGEESPPPTAGPDDAVWIVDPIDGTDAYRSGLAYFGVSVGLAHAGELVLAAFYNPQLDEMYLAARGGGATLNGQAIRVTERGRLDESCFVFGPSNFHRRYRMTTEIKMRSLGSTAAHFAMVADGRACFTFCRPHVWDIGAGALLVTEAGGEVRHLDGRPWRVADHYDAKVIHPPLLAGPADLIASAAKEIAWLT